MATIALASVAVATTFIFTVLFAAVPNVAFVDFVIYSDQSQSLFAGQNLTFDMTPQGLPYGPHALALGHDCNLVLYTKGKRSWSTNTTRKNGQDCYLTLLSNGELVLRNGIHFPVWSSGVDNSTPGNYAFILNYAGVIEVVGPELWTNTRQVNLSDSNPAPYTTNNVYYSGQSTMFTYGVLVTYKNFRLMLRQDCNLIIEERNTWEVMWQTGKKSNSGDCYATLDDYGELFIKHNRRDVLWRSGNRSNVKVRSALVLRYDGRLVIYKKQIWMQPQSLKPNYSVLQGMLLPK